MSWYNPCLVWCCFYMSSHILISILSHLHKKNSLYCKLMIRVHAKRAWVGDYHILPQFISSVKLHVLVYCGLLCRWILYVVNLPQYHIHVHSFLVCILQTADILLKDYICKFFPNTLSEHQRTQDTLHKINLPLTFSPWITGRQPTQREAGNTFTP